MKLNTNSIVRSALFSALIAIGALITIPMGAVPITFQNFFVIMAGLLLTPAEAFLSVLIYTLLGLAGLPIFSGFRGGISYVFMPSFGFIIGFIVGAYVIAKILENNFSFTRMFVAIIIGEIIFYAFGLPYMTYMLGRMGNTPESLYNIFKLGMIPFIPGDILKMVIALIISPKIKKAI